MQIHSGLVLIPFLAMLAAGPSSSSAQDLNSNPAKEATQNGFVRLFPQDGVPKGWIVRRWDNLQLAPDSNATWVVNLDLDHHTGQIRRHDDTLAPPIKDRPRRGHIGFQELSRDGDHVQIRNAFIKILE